MGKNSKISWTHSTFNPWHGCQKVSPACDNCYAERDSKRWGHALWGKDAPRRFLSDRNWAQPLKWDKAAAKLGERHRVFCASMGDVFEDRRDLDGARLRLWKLIEETPNLDWMLLTKRPLNAQFMLPRKWLVRPPANFWFGVTAENKRRANERIPQGAVTNAAVNFVSIEPLLGPIDLEEARKLAPGGSIDWVIVGGESGPTARPMHPDWARSLRDQCVAAGIAFQFKQWGEYMPAVDAVGADGVRQVWMARNGEVRDELQRVDRTKWTLLARVGRKDAGNILDGKLWNEFPLTKAPLPVVRKL